MGLDDFGDEFEMRPVEQDEEFYHIPDPLNQTPKPEEICYYKSFVGKPDPEYDERCKTCDGFPIRDGQKGCMKYTTKQHVDDFNAKYGLSDTNTQREVPTGLEDFPI